MFGKNKHPDFSDTAAVEPPESVRGSLEASATGAPVSAQTASAAADDAAGYGRLHTQNMAQEAAEPASAAPAWSASPDTSGQASLERVAMAALAELRRTRRWRLFFRWTWLIVGLLLVWGLLRSGPSGGTALPDAHTAVIEIRGEIAAGADANAEGIISALQSAMADDAAKGVILLINSPGGSPVQAGMIADEIKRLKALHNKPVVAVVEEAAASAAYYIAAGADSIFVNKASIVGSIGVLMDGFGAPGLLEKLGVERRLLTAGDNKGMLDPFSPTNPRHKELVQTMLNTIHQQFIKVVREGRGSRLKEDADTFSGRFWVGQQAIELGLADQYGTADSVARTIIKAEERVDYTRRDNVAERLVKRFGAAVGAGIVQAMGWQGGIR